MPRLTIACRFHSGRSKVRGVTASVMPPEKAPAKAARMSPSATTIGTAYMGIRKRSTKNARISGTTSAGAFSAAVGTPST